MGTRAARPTQLEREPSIDGSRHVALYVQLAGILRHRIVSRAWTAGHRLPNFETLAAQFGVARITVRQAVALLVREGLLDSRRGRGTFVRDAGVPAAQRPAGSADALSPEEADLEIRVLSKAAPAALPADFAGGHATHDAYVEVTKLHLQGGRPFGMMRIFVAEPVFRAFPRRAIERRKILRLVMNAAPSDVRSIEQTLTVEPADFVLSEQLGCPFGAPVARIMRRAIDDHGRLSYAGVAWYRGDRFAMQATLPRTLALGSASSLLAPTPGARVAPAAKEIP